MIQDIYNLKDTICAIATANCSGAIAMVRVSGKNTFPVIENIFQAKKHIKNLQENHHRVLIGNMVYNDEVIDEVVLLVYKNPNSYTGEDMVEICCHASPYIQRKILEVLTENGCRLAQEGEFSYRSFVNGKKDLSQAEAVADLIASETKISHDVALNQMRGNYSDQLKKLREELVEFSTLLELELDFIEEDISFADRTKLGHLIEVIKSEIESLIQSFAAGNVMKNGVRVAIIGKPNVGKSTLLNTLLQDDRAIVSDIPGTTRDVIEDTMNIDGILYRFIDTAGIRETDESIESMGIEKTQQKIRQADIILYVIDEKEHDVNEIRKEIDNILEEADKKQKIILVKNKIDKENYDFHRNSLPNDIPVIAISAKQKENVDKLLEEISKAHHVSNIKDQSIVSSARHYEALKNVKDELLQIQKGLKSGLASDMIAHHLKYALYHMGLITGDVTNAEILKYIFSGFCIGK